MHASVSFYRAALSSYQLSLLIIGFFTETGILDEYIFEYYDTLHTLGEKYLVEELTEFSRERGALV